MSKFVEGLCGAVLAMWIPATIAFTAHNNGTSFKQEAKIVRERMLKKPPSQFPCDLHFD